MACALGQSRSSVPFRPPPAPCVRRKLASGHRPAPLHLQARQATMDDHELPGDFAGVLRIGPAASGGQHRASCLFKLGRRILPAQSCLLAYWVIGISAATVMGPAVPRACPAAG